MTRFLIYKTGTAYVRATSLGVLWRSISSYFLLSGKDLFTEQRKGKTVKGFVERLRENKTKLQPKNPPLIKKNATRINIHIQTNAVLQCTDLREFHQQGRSRDIRIHQSHLQNPLDLGYNKTVTAGRM